MNEKPDSANLVSISARTPPATITDGPCITETLRNLEAGVGSGKPMSPLAIEKTRSQASALLDLVLAAYENDVAAGEVGAGGSGVASKAERLAGRYPTGLLYGRIQSGKTAAMVTFAALAIDNGFRVVVVLTSDNIKLVDQTAKRFSDLHGIVMSSTAMSTWDNDASHIGKSLKQTGVVLVCAKNQSHLEGLVNFLEKIDAAGYPALVMDDEADQATLDTTVNARGLGRPTAPKFASTINRRTVKNDRPEEAGRSVLEVLRHFIFIQVTATPYALLLQNYDSPLRPSFTKLLEPGDGYTGGESFFSGDHLEDQLPPLIFVREEESAELERGAESAPSGLEAALAFFLVTAGAQLALKQRKTGVLNFLCHTSQKRNEHDRLAELIRKYLEEVGDELRKGTAPGGRTGLHLGQAREDLLRTVPNAPPLEAIVDALRSALPRRQVVVVNSDGENAEFTRGINFIVGGNILGRGLTIENLLVTYYLRHAKVSQMDTMLQHARMFGYRKSSMPFTRVFLPERLARRFHRIHTAEDGLRRLLSDPARRSKIPVEVSEGLRPTRAGVLDTRAILAYTPGQHIYPGLPLVTDNCDAEHRRATEVVSRFGGHFSDEREPHEPIAVTFEQMAELIDLLPYDSNDEDTWDPNALKGLLTASRGRFDNGGWLYCRKMRRKRMAEGALNGDELKKLRAIGKPVLCVFLDTGRQFKATKETAEFERDFTYPSLVLPESDEMPAHVFNKT